MQKLEELFKERQFYQRRLKRLMKMIDSIDEQINREIINFGAYNKNKLRFDDDSLTIKWNDCRLSFTWRNRRRYKILKSVYKSERMRIDEESLVSDVLNDDSLSSNAVCMLVNRIKQMIRNVDFPYIIIRRDGYIWFELKK